MANVNKIPKLTEKMMTLDESKELSWNEYFMGFAIMAGFRSKDAVYQVGACIVNGDNRIISTGYNGFPDCHRKDAIDSGNDAFKGFSWTGEAKHRVVCHAELNAITNATQDLRESTLYVTRFPCVECAKLIVQSRIGKVYYLSDEKAKKHKIPSDDNDNFTEFDASMALFNFAKANLINLKKQKEGFEFAESLPGWKESKYLARLYEKLRTN